MASAAGEAYAVLLVRKHADKNWVAAMTFLERRFPSKWKRRDEVSNVTSFDPSPQVDAEKRETRMFEDAEATKLMHDALDRVARSDIDSTAEDLPELPPGEG